MTASSEIWYCPSSPYGLTKNSTTSTQSGTQILACEQAHVGANPRNGIASSRRSVRDCAIITWKCVCVCVGGRGELGNG